jgi:hypothetical protein
LFRFVTSTICILCQVIKDLINSKK